LLARLAPSCSFRLTVLLCLQNETAQCLAEILGRGRKEDRENEERGAGVRRRREGDRG